MHSLTFLRSSLYPLVALLASILGVVGCAPRTARPVVYVNSGAYLAAVAIEALSDPYPYCKDCRETSDIPVYPPGPADYGAPPLAASPRDRVPHERAAVRFDAPRARSALSAIDLSSCRTQGAPRGYGHAVVTYASGGFPVKVLIDDPGGLGDAAVQCVGNHLGSLSVTAFEGPATQVGVTWFIR